MSVQVVNEVANVCSRKLRMPTNDINLALQTIGSFCSVVSLTNELPKLALSIMDRYMLSYCDELIVATALTAECSVVLSEDMQHGLCIVNTQIVNPFRP